MKASQPIDGNTMEDILSEEIVDEVCIIGDPQEVREKVIERYDGLADSLYFYSFHDSFSTSNGDEEGIKVEQNLLRVIEAFKNFK
jgi:alkanesulfonate monooxygenase SsuD/methylene tetrahydromethanopterin reductase-like flavin-dependent oxidoreductase (luciferase family)